MKIKKDNAVAILGTLGAVGEIIGVTRQSVFQTNEFTKPDQVKSLIKAMRKQTKYINSIQEKSENELNET